MSAQSRRTPADLHPFAHRDRHGYVHLPLDAVVAVAGTFGADEPQTLDSHVNDEEAADA